MDGKTTLVRKTLRLRIVRPFYGATLEEEIAARKEALRQAGETGELKSAFWEQLKREHPEMVLWSEFKELLTQIQKTIAPICCIRVL